jgi:hypothetical protein
MHIHRVNPFQQLPTESPAAPKAADSPSFLDSLSSAMSPGTKATSPAPAATVPAMPAATYAGSNGYFDSAAVDARSAASSAMLGALGNNDVKAYQQAAANFLAASPPGSGLPVWASTITVDPRGNLINTNCAGVAYDGTLVGEDHLGYAGMMNPVPGVPNIADGTANYLGAVVNRTT